MSGFSKQSRLWKQQVAFVLSMAQTPMELTDPRTCSLGIGSALISSHDLCSQTNTRICAHRRAFEHRLRASQASILAGQRRNKPTRTNEPVGRRSQSKPACNLATLLLANLTVVHKFPTLCNPLQPSTTLYNPLQLAPIELQQTSCGCSIRCVYASG